jgi:hypothetical protein
MDDIRDLVAMPSGQLCSNTKSTHRSIAARSKQRTGVIAQAILDKELSIDANKWAKEIPLAHFLLSFASRSNQGCACS